jgi:hypothetical protein
VYYIRTVLPVHDMIAAFLGQETRMKHQNPKRPNGGRLTVSGFIRVVFVLVVCLSSFAYYKFYNRYEMLQSRANQGDAALSSEVAELRGLLEEHENSNRVIEKSILQKVKEVAASNRSVSILKTTYQDMLGKIEALESTVFKLESKDKQRDAADGEVLEDKKLVTVGNLRGVADVQSPPSSSAPSSGAVVSPLGMDTVLLIIASNRPDYLEKTLSFVVQYHPR